MFKRSDVRLCGYKMKQGLEIRKPNLLEILPHLEEVMADEDTWEGFADYWDVIVRPDEIIRVATEMDETFINDFCVAIRTKLKMGIKLEQIVGEFSDREQNLYDIIKINYLGDTIDWLDYKNSWIIELNREYNRIEVLNLKTDRKIVDIPKAENPVLKKAVKEAISQDEEALLSKIKMLLGKD